MCAIIEVTHMGTRSHMVEKALEKVTKLTTLKKPKVLGKAWLEKR